MTLMKRVTRDTVFISLSVLWLCAIDPIAYADLHDPQGTAYTYHYDNGNFLSGVDLPVGNITINDYEWLAPTRITLPGGVQQDYNWTGLLELEGMTVSDSSQNVIADFSYSYNKLRLLEEKTDPNGTISYDYDDNWRLTNAGNDQFTFDEEGNRISENASTPWNYNDFNQLESRPGVNYQYDANGNRISQDDNGVITQYDYDVLNRLIKVEDGSGTVLAEYGYDPFDRRLWKEVNGIRTYFIYAAEGLIGEYDDSGNPISEYGYFPGALWSTNPLFLRQNGDYAFFHKDQRAAPVLLTDMTGSTVWSAQYDAHGQATVSPSSTMTNNLRLPGQYFDGETNLHYNFRRYYDPTIGSYITSDPIGLAGGLNQYLYVNANPVNFIDPRGECLLQGAIVEGGVEFVTQAYYNWQCDTEFDGSSIFWSSVSGAFCGIGRLRWLDRFFDRRPNPPKDRVDNKPPKDRDKPCGDVNNSFPADTLVHTEEGLKPISEIKEGDKVLAYAEWTEETSYQDVTNVITGEKKYEFIEITLVNGEVIEATSGHPLYVYEKGWRDASELKRGDRLVGKDKQPVLVKKIIKVNRKEVVFNLSVANVRTFLVADSGVLTHNCSDVDSPVIDPKDVADKTPDEIDKLARDKGLIPKGPDPKNGIGAYIDPKTGKQRVLCHTNCSNPHGHVNDPDGNRLDINGDHVPPESPDAHLPINYP